MIRRCLLVLVVLAACGDNRKGGPITPEQAVATATDGKAVVVEGQVHTVTFDNIPDDGEFTLLDDRFLLIRTVVPLGVRNEDLDSGNITAAWALGVHLPASTLDDVSLPPIGATVRVSGTFEHREWASENLPMIVDATIEVLEGGVTLAMTGDACDNDADCHERLICDRATLRCASPPAAEWGDEWRNINGACAVDADCPLGQLCDTTHTTSMDDEYAPPYFVTRDGGKHLCVPDPALSLDELCPTIYTTADLSGGRFISGKEICVEGETWLALRAEDGDTHLQMTIDEPLPYPSADTPYWIFGSTTENGPPYKNPARPQGAVIDPDEGDRAIAIGTMHFDPDHGWFEMHSVKQYYPVAGKKRRNLRKLYPKHPGDITLEDIERGRVEGGVRWEKHDE